MSTYKTTNGDYIVSVGPFTGNAWTGTMTVNGNLNVEGNITYVSDLAVNDAFIRVAANNTGTVQDMGIVATKTANTYAALRFDTVANAWQVSSSTDANGAGTFTTISTLTGNTTVAGSDTQIQFNQSSGFGASANLTFDYSNNKLTVSGYEVLGNIGSAPSYTGNGVALFNKATGAGQTGLFVVGNTTPQDELISLTRSRLYSIIF